MNRTDESDIDLKQVGPLLRYYVKMARGPGTQQRIWNTSGYNMDSTRVVTTAKIRSKPCNYNDIFVVTIVDLEKKSCIIVFDCPEFCADENISVDICATQVDWYNYYCFYNSFFFTNSA